MKYPLTIPETLPLFDCLFFNLFQNLEAKNARIWKRKTPVIRTIFWIFPPEIEIISIF